MPESGLCEWLEDCDVDRCVPPYVGWIVVPVVFVASIAASGVEGALPGFEMEAVDALWAVCGQREIGGDHACIIGGVDVPVADAYA